MNRTFSVVWSGARRAWVVASELANRRGKGGRAIDRRAIVCEVVPNRVAAWRSPAAAVRVGIALGLLTLNLPARAIDYYWDTDGATAGAGGAAPGGTWSAGATTLSTDANGAAATGAITTTTADRLFFSAGTNATGSYAVTVGGTRNIGRLTFQEGSVNLTGGTINFGAVSGIIDGDATPDTISAVISGTNGVRFSGGTVTLTGTNIYTGTMQVGGAGLSQASVILAAPGGNAVSGNFLQLGGNNYTSAGFLTLGAPDQINDTATVQMNSGHYSGSSVFSLNGFNETIGGINLHHQGNASGVTFRNGAATDVTVTLAGSGTYTTASGDRVTGRTISNGGAGKLNVVVALAGAGSQTFAGQAPIYTGTTTVNSGTLILWNTSSWASNLSLNGGTLQLNQTLVAPVNAGGNAPAPRNHINTIGGTGGTLRKTGDGTVILSGLNTYQGATQIDGGTLRAGSASAFGNSSAVTLANAAGATMDFNNINITLGSLAGGGTAGGNLTLGSGRLTTGGNNTSTIYGGVITGTGALIKAGSGTFALTGASIYSGGTTIGAGVLQIGNGGSSGSIAGDVVNNAVLAFNRSDTFTFGGGISGSGSLSQIGSGITVLTGANSYTGGTAINAGALRISSDAALGNAAGGLRFAGGTLHTTADIVSGRTVDLATTGTFLNDASTTLTLNGAVSGGGSLVKNGDGTTVLAGANSYTGLTNIAAGTLRAGSITAFGNNSAVTLANVAGATMDLGGFNIGIGSLAGGGAIGGNVALGSGTLTTGGDNASAAHAGTIDGTGGLVKTGTGTQTLSGANSYTGPTSVAAGTLRAGSATAFGIGSAVTLANVAGATMDLNGFNVSVGSLAGGGTSGGDMTLGSGTLTTGGNNTSTSYAGGIGGSGALIKTGTGTFTLTGTNTYSGGTTISGGTLQLGSGGATGSIVGNVANNGTLAFGSSDTLNFDGVITGTGAIRQVGPGLTRLTGNSAAFAGATTIEAGTVAVNGRLCGTMNVLSGGRLQGVGTVCDTTNGGTVAPGNSIGTLTIAGHYAGSGGLLEMEGMLAGTGSPADRLVITGNATGVTEVRVTDTGGATGALTGSGNTNGISIIQVGGASTAGAFRLQGGYAAAGPYQYHLIAFAPGDSEPAEADPLLGTTNFWDYRLQSVLDASNDPVPVPQIAGYQALPTGALRYGSSLLNALHKRLGEIRHLASIRGGEGERDARGEFFLREQASRSDFFGDRGPDFDQSIGFIQAGGSFVKWDIGEAASTLRLGGALSYGGSSLGVKSTSAEVDLRGLTLALMTTYQGARGEYLDVLAQGTQYRTKVNTSERGRTGDPEGRGWGLSFEGGYPLELGGKLILEPQVQLAYQRVRFDRITDVDNIMVDIEGGESVRGRFGARVQKTYEVRDQQWAPYLEFYVLREFHEGGKINANEVVFRSDTDGTSLQLGAGLNAQFARDTALFLALGYEKGVSKAGANTLSGTFGVRMNF